MGELRQIGRLELDRATAKKIKVKTAQLQKNPSQIRSTRLDTWAVDPGPIPIPRLRPNNQDDNLESYQIRDSVLQCSGRSDPSQYDPFRQHVPVLNPERAVAVACTEAPACLREVGPTLSHRQ